MAKLKEAVGVDLSAQELDLLKRIKIHTVADFLLADIQTICEKVPQVHKKDVLRLRSKLIATYAPLPLYGDDAFDEAKCYRFVISTGIKMLNKLLRGGLSSGKLYEICGRSSTGKSLLCTNIAINISLKFHMPLITYIDSTGGFDCERATNLIANQKQSARKILENIHIVRLFSIYSLLSYLDEIKRNSDDQKVIIIDSIADICGAIALDGSDFNGFNLISQLTSTLRYIASECNICFLVVNNVIERTNVSQETVSKPALGKLWASAPDMRILMSKEEENSIILTQMKNPYGDSTKCSLKLTDAGIIC